MASGKKLSICNLGCPHKLLKKNVFIENSGWPQHFDYSVDMDLIKAWLAMLPREIQNFRIDTGSTLSLSIFRKSGFRIFNW
ncbi:hypothetical protein GCM10007867_06120 [Gluconobacter cerinus]|uniref:Uncharacterized protein n=1 Tax=Gluconobacter cerinus TaxID=38307 RepID=A0AAV5NBC7_9PROT|nr:hypothetical protein GCM10007867_06120 [Gluconobacter cerinus]